MQLIYIGLEWLSSSSLTAAMLHKAGPIEICTKIILTGPMGIELSSINKMRLVKFPPTLILDQLEMIPYCTSRKNSLQPIELSSINKVSLV